jgi:hypothetical protein
VQGIEGHGQDSGPEQGCEKRLQDPEAVGDEQGHDQQLHDQIENIPAPDLPGWRFGVCMFHDEDRLRDESPEADNDLNVGIFPEAVPRLFFA